MPGTVGFVHDTSSTISAIREILGHYELGFPVVRELLQNADDAGATELEIGWLPGLEGTRNPLLAGPTLVALNDGPFTESNGAAIRRISGSDKDSQDGSIGKFGRGLKSLFHLCEGFVVASSVQADGGAGPWKLDQANLLTPWSGSEYHQDWGTFDDSERDAIEAVLTPFVRKGRHWFCLWVPLRRRGAGGPPWIDRAEFPGDFEAPPSFLREEVKGNCSETMRSLPLLGSLESVRYRLDDSEPCEVRFKGGSARRRFLAGQTRPGEWPLRGRLVVGGVENVYAGYELLLRAAGVFEQLKNRDEWPVRNVITGGKEKGEPHAAVVFSALPAEGRGSLRISDAVFLPVGRRPGSVECPIGWDIDLILHGYSFVNSNRTAVELSGDDANSRLKADWNAELRARGILECVVPALDEFVGATAMSFKDAEVLTDSLRTWLRQRPQDLDAVHQSRQWLPCIGPAGDLAYKTVPTAQPYCELPARPADETSPFSTFPALADLANRAHITFKGLARLAGPPASWPPAELQALIESIPASEVFASDAYLEYVAALFDANAGAIASLQQPLVRKLQEALRSPGLSCLRERHSFRRILRRVNPDLTVTFDDRHLAAAARVVNEATGYLASAAVSVLVLPASAVGEAQQGDPAPFELGDDDARGLLQALVEAPVSLRSEDAFRQIRARLADMVFRMDGRAREVARAEFGDSRLFRGWVAGSGDADISFNDIQRAVGTRRLLRRNVSGGVDPAPALAAAAALVGDLTVVPDYIQAAGAELPRCSVEGCAEILLRAPRLAPISQRRAFLEKLLGSGSREPAVIRAVRFLLHGNPAAVASDEPLLFGDVQGDVWSKLAHQALGETNWRFVDGVLVQHIPAALHAEFGLERIDAATVTALIRQRGPGSLNCGDSSLTDADREKLLREVYHRDLLRALPMHRDVNGTFGPIDEHTYVEGAFDLARDLAHAVRLLRPLGPEMEAKLGLSQWTPGAAIDEALAQEHPGAFAQTILDALAAMSGPIAAVTRSTLRSTAWLPLTVGAFVRPEDVVHIKGLDAHIARIAAKCEGAYYDVGMLSRDVREHPGFPRLQVDVFQTGREALETLPLMIEAAALSDLFAGPIELPADRLDAFVRAFQGAPIHVMKAASLFEAALQVFPAGVVTTKLALPLLQPIPVGRLVDILKYLADRHQTAGGDEKNSVLDLFERYLVAARGGGFDSGWLSEVQLLNQRGQWRPSAELCHDYPNVDPVWLLDAKQAEILGLGEPEDRGKAPSDSPAVLGSSHVHAGRAGAVLAEYFRPWAGTVAPEAIGCFLAFLGGDAAIEGLAQEYLSPRDIHIVRAQGPVPMRVLNQQRFEVKVVPRGEPQVVTNLLGKPLAVRLAESLRGIIRNRLHRDAVGRGVALLELIEVQETDSAERLSTLLQGSLGTLVGSIYFGARNATHWEHECPAQNSARTRVALRRACLQCGWSDGSMPAPSAFWDGVVEQSYIVHLQATQDCLLEHLLTSAKQLRVDTSQDIRELTRLWEDARHLEAEARNSTRESQQREWSDKAHLDLDRTRERLRDLLTADADSQHTFLAGVRLTMESVHQYRARSIPFELFQNADDAAVQLDELAHESDPHARRYPFVVSTDRGSLAFAHWGRPINDSRAGSGIEELRASGFHRDLEKMLMLGASDKWAPGEAEEVTGKFGLGFKSVFLLSDAPRILSGRLAVRVLGGVYPQNIIGPEREAITGRLAELGERRNGTLIELPLRDGFADKAEEAVSHFRELAPILAVFARRTNRIVLRTAGREESLEWAPREVNRSPHCLIGSLPGATSRGLPAHALLVTAGTGALLLGLDARGVVRMPAHVPGVWVTAPTSEAVGAGFALNGPFELHAGRSELASTALAANNATAMSLGVALGEAFVGLVAAAEADWDDLRRDLVLSEDTDPYAFWESMLEVLSQVRRPGEAFDLLRAALWSDAGRGAAKLFGSCQVLPSGLPGDHRRLLLAREVRFHVVGLLATPEFFAAVMSLDQVSEQAHPGTAIARSVVENIPLVGLLGGEPLDLAGALQWVFQGMSYVVEPSLASTLGELLGPEHLDESHGTKSERDEAVHLRNLLNDVRFRSEDGSVHRPRELVAGGMAAKGMVDDDEVARAKFAPEAARLSTDYDEAGMRFFVLCRGRMEANSSTLVDWGRQAEGDKLDSFLEYTQKGRLRADVQDVVRDDPAWLLEKGAAERLQSLVEDPRDALFAQAALGLGSPGPAVPPVVWQPSLAPPLTTDEIARGLGLFAAWWQRIGAERIRSYDKSVYPEGRRLLAGLQAVEIEDRRDAEVRKLWMRLFLLGAAHTLGRQRPEQHREFLGRFERQGWLTLFATPHSQWDGREWIERLKQHVDGLVDDDAYARWMTLFIPLFQVAYRLDEYIELFVVADRDLGSGMSLDQFLNPAQNPAQSGGGSRPPGVRTGLGLGAHFVLRELAREGLITKPPAQQHCIVPRERVIALLAELGLDVRNESKWERSRRMAEYLQRHLGDDWHFDGAFDIALYEVASDTGPQVEFFGRVLVPNGGWQ